MNAPAEPGPAAAVCLGEAMVVLRPSDSTPLARAHTLRRSVGGAEANVAGGLASLSVPAAFVSRLGADPFGDYVTEDLAARGVAVRTQRDADRPTGLYFKDTHSGTSTMYYYRAGSAASAMDGALLDADAVAPSLQRCNLVHTSGITAGIVADDSDLVPSLTALRDRLGFTLSVDLNWRPALWHGRSPRRVVDLLRTADIVLLGADEAETALGTDDPDELRTILGPRPRLVIKSESAAATEYPPHGPPVRVPALDVDVVEPIGAGDGFAAGYLAGELSGRSPAERLRMGHLMAAHVLTESGDHAVRPPDTAAWDRLIHADDAAWGSVRIAPDAAGAGRIATSAGDG